LHLPKRKKTKLKSRFGAATSRKNLDIITNKKRSITKKKKALLQEGEGVGLVVATLAPLIAKLFEKSNTMKKSGFQKCTWSHLVFGN